MKAAHNSTASSSSLRVGITKEYSVKKKKMKRLLYLLLKIGQAKNEKKMICMRMCFCVVIKLKHDNTSFSPFLSPPLSLFPFSSSLFFPLLSSRVLPLSCFLSLSLSRPVITHTDAGALSTRVCLIGVSLCQNFSCSELDDTATRVSWPAENPRAEESVREHTIRYTREQILVVVLFFLVI